MHILDKSLDHILEQILNPLLEKEGLGIVKAIFEKYYSNLAFRHRILELKFKHHKRKLAQLQILAQKQDLEAESEVFQIVRETIRIENFNQKNKIIRFILFKEERETILKGKTFCII